MADKMFSFPMDDRSNGGFQKALDYSKRWCEEHQWAVGVGEMALGAAVIAWGLQDGLISIGKDVIGTELSDGGIFGGATGSTIGGIGGLVMGSIGIAGAFTFGIPALALASGGAVILGAAGYGAGDLVQHFLTPPGGFTDFFFGVSILSVGLALLIDGARRVMLDVDLLKVASNVKDGVIYVTQLTAKVIAKTGEELQAIIKKLDVATGMAMGTAGIAGAAIGSTLAASSVTLLGSHALGGVAISLGLVSAPVWPVVALGAAGVGVGLAAWKGAKYLFWDDPTEEQSPK